MAKTFRKIVNAPHRAMRILSNKIEATEPRTVAGMALREVGLVTTDLSRFLFWATKYVTLDNHLLRGMEKWLKNRTPGKNKNGKSRAGGAFAKKYPNLSAHVLYFATLGIFAGGAYGHHKINERDGDDIDGKDKTEIVTPQTNTETVDDNQITLNDIIDFSNKDEKTVDGFLAKYWNDIVVGLTELETYIETYKVLPKEKRATGGLGVTYVYSIDKKTRKITRSELHKGDEMPTLSQEAHFMQLAMHLKYETVKMLLNDLKKASNINDKEKVALILAGYQRPADMKRIIAKLKTAKSEQARADAFLAMPAKLDPDFRKGTIKRRWMCGAIAIGKVSMQDLLNMQRDVFTVGTVDERKKGEHLKMDAATVQNILRKDKGHGTVREFLSESTIGENILSSLEENLFEKTFHKIFGDNNHANDSKSNKYMAATKNIRKHAHSGKNVTLDVRAKNVEL